MARLPLAAALFACAATVGRPSVSALLSLVGIAVLASAMGHGSEVSRWATLLPVGVVVGTWGERMAGFPDTGIARWIWVAGIGISTLIAWLQPSYRRSGMLLSAAPAVVGGLGVVVAFMLDPQFNGVGTDVFLAHVEAARVLADGGNPYSSAVTIPNGSPWVEPGSVIAGYAYPPVTLLSFVAVTWLVGDPRWLLVVAFCVFTVILAWTAKRENLLIVLTLWASFPIWPLLLLSAWTEPLTLLLVGFSVAYWRAGRTSAFWCGLGLASKQYMAVAFPLLLVVPDWSRRARWTLGVAVASLVPFAIWSPVIFVRAVGLSGLSIGFRPDTQSLAGLVNELGLQPIVSPWLAIAGALLVIWWASGRIRRMWQLPAAMALVLAVFFWLYLGFPNYWFLVFGLTCLALALQRNEAGSFGSPAATSQRSLPRT